MADPRADSNPTVTLSDGALMPQLGLGVWQTPAGKTAEVVRHAVEAGYRAVDTAVIYDNEDGVGEALADHPDIFVTTKVWNTDQGFDATLRAFDISAKKLRREMIDLYLIHWPAPRKDRYVDTWKALVALKESGRVRSIGVSNFMADNLRRIIDDTGITPVVNQIELHPDFQQRELRAVHAELGIETESWSPLGQGRLLADPALSEIARKHGVSTAQIIIRWHLDQGLIVIPKSVHRDRIRQNIDVFGFALDQDDLTRIEALDRPNTRVGPNPATASF